MTEVRGIQDLNSFEIVAVGGGNDGESGGTNPFAVAAGGMAAASVAASALALVPTPASPALGAFSLVTRGLAVGFGLAAAATS